MIDTNKKILLTDDRSKGNDFLVDSILFEDNDVCLCNAISKDEQQTILNHILFSKKDGEVLSKNLLFYYASNV